MKERSRARILAFQALYHWELNEENREDLSDFSWNPDPISDEARAFALLLFQGTLENREEVDDLITRNLTHWEFSRVPKVDLAILRLGVYSLLYQKEIPAAVTINEAVNMAKKFGGDKSFKFVNGLLDNIRKKSP